MTDTPRKPFKGIIMLLILGFALCLVHVFNDSGTTLVQRSLGAFLGVVALVGAWRYWQMDLFDRLPLPEFALVQIYVYFGMPTVTGSLRRGVAVGSDGVTMALVACLVFTACALCGTAVGLRLGGFLRDRLGRLLPATLSSGSRVILPLWVAVVVVANTGALLYLPSSLRFPATVMAEGSGVLVFMALQHGDDGDHTKGLRRVVPVAIGIAMAGLLSGMMEQVLQPLLIAATLTLLLRRRLPVAWIMTGALLFLLLNPAKHAFREQRKWSGFDKDLAESTQDQLVVGPIDAAAEWWTAINSTWEGETDSGRHTRSALDRLNYLSGVARTVDWAGKRVPFDRGSRWDVILEFFVPRALYPDKPGIARVFNDRYNYLFGLQTAHGTRSTTVALPLIADGYWNFGWLGVVSFGALAGLYWGGFASLWHRQHWGLSWFAMAFFSACNVITPFYGYAVGMVTTAAVLGLGAWLLSIASAAIPGTQSVPVAASPR